MQSTCGLSIAASMRSVGLAVEGGVERGDDPVELARACSSATSTEPSARMFASTPRSTWNGFDALR